MFLIIVHYINTKVFCKCTNILYTYPKHNREDSHMLGEQIKTLRTARNLSQVQLAMRLGVTKQSVSNWENNNILPSVDMLKKIAQFFSCSTDYLLELDSGRIFIETTNLSPEQIAHIQQLVSDLELLNKQLRK